MRCNSKNVSAQKSQSVWVGYVLAFLVAYFGFQTGSLSSIIITLGIGATIIIFYKKWINKKYYCNECKKSWTDGGFD